MHNLNLETALVSGEGAVALCPQIPIKDVSFILGSDLVGGRVLAAAEVIPTVTYLGEVVVCGKVCPIRVKVEAIMAFPVPTSQRKLKRFLGMAD